MKLLWTGLKIDKSKSNLDDWHNLIKVIGSLDEEIKIGVVGKIF